MPVIVHLRFPSPPPSTTSRAYRKVVLVQQLSEMEEIVQYQTLCATASRETAHEFITHLRQMWASRLRGCQRNVDVRCLQDACTLRCAPSPLALLPAYCTRAR